MAHRQHLTPQASGLQQMPSHLTQSEPSELFRYPSYGPHPLPSHDNKAARPRARRPRHSHNFNWKPNHTPISQRERGAVVCVFSWTPDCAAKILKALLPVTATKVYHQFEQAITNVPQHNAKKVADLRSRSHEQLNWNMFFVSAWRNENYEMSYCDTCRPIPVGM